MQAKYYTILRLLDYQEAHQQYKIPKNIISKKITKMVVEEK